MLVDDIAKFSKTLCITGDTDRGNEEDCLIEEPESLTDCEERWVTQGNNLTQTCHNLTRNYNL